jgi:hypothetical protein
MSKTTWPRSINSSPYSAQMTLWILLMALSHAHQGSFLVLTKDDPDQLNPEFTLWEKNDQYILSWFIATPLKK